MGGPGSGKKPREYPPEIVELICGMYRDGMTVKEIRAVAPKGYRIQTILERYLPKRRSTAIRDQRGKKNSSWKATPSYTAVHLRLRVAYGPATDHLCVDCGARSAEDWSYDNSDPEGLLDEHGRRYSRDLTKYKPRCKKCHAALDAAWRKEVMPYV